MRALITLSPLMYREAIAHSVHLNAMQPLHGKRE